MDRTAAEQTIKSPRGLKALNIAREVRRRLALHVEKRARPPQMGSFRQDVETAMIRFKDLLQPGKFKTLIHLIGSPASTIETTSEIFDAWEKCFAGRDPKEEITFTNQKLVEPFREYWQSAAGMDFLKQELWPAVRTDPSALVCVDYSSESSKTRNPYAYIVNSEHLKDCKIRKDGEVDHATFIQESAKDDPKGSRRYAVVCDEAYRVFLTSANGITKLEHEALHGLGYAPLKPVWQAFADGLPREAKAGPLAAQLDALDWLLYFETAKRYQDVYAGFPIMWGYEGDCRYHDPTGATHCDGGTLYFTTGGWVLTTRLTPMECPSCGNQAFSGPGTYVRVSVPDDPEQAPLSPPVGIVSPDVDNLKWITDEAERLSARIYQATTGSLFEAINNQAVNEKQVTSLFESRKAQVKRIAENVDRVGAWIGATMARIRHGDAFISMDFSLGNEFFLYSADDALARYNEGKKEGFDAATLDSLYLHYLQTIHRLDEEALERARMLSELDPVRHVSLKEAIELKNAGGLSARDLTLKSRLSSLIARFERLNGPVQLFASGIDSALRVDKVRAALLTYIEEEDTSEQPPAAEPPAALVE